MSTGTAGVAPATAGAAAAQGVDDWAASAANYAAEQAAAAGGVVDPFAGIDEMDTDGVKLGAGLIEIEGAYHLEIADADVKAELNRNNRHEINLRCVALHSTPGLSPAGSAM